MELNPLLLARLVEAALDEDIGLGCATTQTTVDPDAIAEARLWAKEPLVVCGVPVAREVFRRVDPALVLEARAAEGQAVPAGAEVAVVRGPCRALLVGERVALNLLQRMSGIATAARAFVEELEGTGVAVSDTRKTVPGMRMLDKYAVSVGGGANHRWSLESGILIKDNHLLAAGGVTEAVRRARARAPHLLRVQVECKHLHQVEEAAVSGADAVLLDNMDLATLERALAIVGGRLFVEVSGGIRLDTIRAVALPGVNLISTGALTHSVRASDIALDLLAVSTRMGPFTVQRLEQCTSTNDVARNRARAGGEPWHAVVAEVQTSARGREGRAWHSPSGAHLALSVHLAPKVALALAPRLSLIAGVAVARAVSAWVPAHDVELEWPNDVLVQGKKVAGILLESSSADGRLEFAIVGVGINANAHSSSFPPELRARAASLSAFTGGPVDREALLRAVLAVLAELVASFEAHGGALPEDELSGWIRPNRRVKFLDAAGEWRWGHTRHVRADGALVVKQDSGAEVALFSGEVVYV
jgi:nicotinate-nucleotide pyrophosphorylase (carboxylating)